MVIHTDYPTYLEVSATRAGCPLGKHAACKGKNIRHCVINITMKPRKNIAYRLSHLLRGVGYSRRLSIRSLVLDPACKQKKIEISFKSIY